MPKGQVGVVASQRADQIVARFLEQLPLHQGTSGPELLHPGLQSFVQRLGARLVADDGLPVGAFGGVTAGHAPAVELVMLLREFRVLRAAIAEEVLSSTGKPMSSADDAQLGALLDASLIATARLFAERDRVEAERANRLKDEFLATVSHELRTPLQSIIGWATVLRDEELGAEHRSKGLSVIERNARDLARVVDDLLDVSEIITGRVGIALRPVDAAAVVRDVAATVEVAAVAKGVTLRIAIDEVGLVLLDQDRFRQIAWNLLSNAVKFTAVGGHVELRLCRTSQLLQLAIADDGQGISDSFLPFVFDRFRQGDGRATRPHRGLGLGLALVRHLTELHGGAVSVESAGLGRGAQFRVDLPMPIAVVEAPPPKASSSSPPPADPLPRLALQGTRILIVEDEDDARELVVIALERQGAKVFGVGSVREATDVLRSEVVDVVVSDLGLPEEDGYALVRWVRGASLTLRALPMLALTAFATTEERVREAGFDAYLAKPADPPSLVRAIVALAERARAPQL